MKTKAYAYVDGSFNPETRVYGAGGFIDKGTGEDRIKFITSGLHPGKATMRNVAGEIEGVLYVLRLAFDKLGIRAITIFHDYDGLEKWVSGEWKCKNKYSKKYVQDVKKFISLGMEIYFEHVKGHSGNQDNEIADRLAKEAVGIFK